jgi:predicted GTPase
MSDSAPLRFAIVGHPNEGKSSVVSTLAEDDTVPVSPVPGETRICHNYPVIIDGRMVVEFIDTPGFQNPRHTLAWFEKFGTADEHAIRAFRESHRALPAYQHECQLLEPIEKGAGIIYVVDGSRPLRQTDLAEMEILRRTGRPRLAIINAKDQEKEYLEEWKAAFRRHFNSVRVFNAHHANYAQRMALLDTLKSIDQDWQPAMEEVIEAFRDDWERRVAAAARLIGELLEASLSHVALADCGEGDDREREEQLKERYRKELSAMERRFHGQIRKLFKHNIFRFEPSSQSALQQDLFSERVWRVLGLDRSQLMWAAALAGGTGGAGLDILFSGISAGVFTASGALLGALSAYFGGERLARVKAPGPRFLGLDLSPRLGRTQLKIGPMHNLQFFFILLDRALIFFSYVINWAHGRREQPPDEEAEKSNEGFISNWHEEQRRRATRYFEAIRKAEDDADLDPARRDFQEILRQQLLQMSRAGNSNHRDK